LSACGHDTVETSTIACGDEDEVIDVWTFEVSEEDVGTEFGFEVDTAAEGSAFDPMMNVYGPAGEGCLRTEADDSFECTFPPAEFECPGLNFTPTVAGTHTITVHNIGDCDSAVGIYTVANSGGFEMTLTEDEASYDSLEDLFDEFDDCSFDYSDGGCAAEGDSGFSLESSAAF
jgi:hypothetical protein